MKLTKALLLFASVVASVVSEDTDDVITLPKKAGIVYLIPVFHPDYLEGIKNGELSNDIDTELQGKALRIPAFVLAVPTKAQAEEDEAAPKRAFHSRHRRAAYAARGGGHGGGSGGGGGFGGGGGRGLSETGCQSSSSSSSSSFGSGRGAGEGGGGGGGGGGGHGGGGF